MKGYFRYVSPSLLRLNSHQGPRACKKALLLKYEIVRDQHASPPERPEPLVSPSIGPQRRLRYNKIITQDETARSQRPSPSENSPSLTLPSRTSPDRSESALKPHRFVSQPKAEVSRVVGWSPEGSVLKLELQGLRDSTTYSNLWLRDHCLCAQCTHPQTKQRQLDTYEIDPDIKIEALTTTDRGLTIKWANPAHESHFPWPWLLKYRQKERSNYSRPRTHGAKLAEYPAVPYSRIMSDRHGLLDYIRSIHNYGFCFAPDTPVTTEATEALLNRIAFIRPTHYGGFWDFTSVSNPIDTAYTNFALPAHTDTTYFTDPCGLQLFHVLSHTNGAGGESILVDGFRAAAHLYTIAPHHYNILSSVPIVSHASGYAKVGSINNMARQRGYPVFTHHLPDETRFKPRQLSQIRWNNDDRSPLTRFGSLAAEKSWYEAARAWSNILKMPEFEITVQLQPGNPVIFDNWRVLHGRRAFTGERRVCGGYIGMDDFRARLRGLSEELEGEKAGEEQEREG